MSSLLPLVVVWPIPVYPDAKPSQSRPGACAAPIRSAGLLCTRTRRGEQEQLRPEATHGAASGGGKTRPRATVGWRA